ncbi:PqqD family protein [Clostridium ganghwense]|uniref:PqqD family protein n=1 Tax=Clostridium ganghwense TaxID=312089 RepID=A0ABT4CQ73_9CLOT|nr:PqqD family protein [Clostridium ganghwense]MCY6370231.1 PqqD family protein [Clostridium ganghwense]
MKQRNNLLEFIPRKNEVKKNIHLNKYINNSFSKPTLYEKVEDDSNLTIVIRRDSKMDRFFLKIFRKSHKELYVHLDEIGSFIWNRINGKRTVLDLCKEFMKTYGVEEKEAINRTVHFMKILKNNKFIKFEIHKDV